MSVNFSNVQVGDRIKLTRANGDEFSFRATWVSDGRVQSRTDAHWPSEWDTLEILEKALPEAPTRTGAMVHGGNRHKPYVVLDRTGRWNSEYGLPVSETEVRENLRDGWKVVFEGLDYDA